MTPEDQLHLDHWKELYYQQVRTTATLNKVHKANIAKIHSTMQGAIDWYRSQKEEYQKTNKKLKAQIRKLEQEKAEGRLVDLGCSSPVNAIDEIQRLQECLHQVTTTLKEEKKLSTKLNKQCVELLEKNDRMVEENHTYKKQVAIYKSIQQNSTVEVLTAEKEGLEELVAKLGRDAAALEQQRDVLVQKLNESREGTEVRDLLVRIDELEAMISYRDTNHQKYLNNLLADNKALAKQLKEVMSECANLNGQLVHYKMEAVCMQKDAEDMTKRVPSPEGIMKQIEKAAIAPHKTQSITAKKLNEVLNELTNTTRVCYPTPSVQRNLINITIK